MNVLLTLMEKVCPTPGKARYLTRASANRHRPRMVGCRLRAYLCECGWYHLSKSMPRGA